jgi:hypothetical protein
MRRKQGASLCKRCAGCPPAGATTATASAALLRQLAGQDAVLGPNVPGRDPLEDALAGFAGAPGGPPLHPWEAGLAPRSAPGACCQQAAPCIGALQGLICTAVLQPAGAGAGPP